MKTTVIHHSADFDGIFCREIARKFLPDAELVGWDFKDDPINPLTIGETLYVMDLPLDRPFGFRFEELIDDLEAKAKYGNRIGNATTIIWIDHHASSIASHPKDIPGYRIDGVAACRLAWQWFLLHEAWDPRELHPPGDLPGKEDFVERRVSEPLAVRLAGEYDIWDKRDPNAELFQHGLRSEELYSVTWDSLLGMNGGSTVIRLLNQGRALQYAQNKQNESIIKSLGFDLEWEGMRFLACNHARYNSHLFLAGLKPEHDACFGFKWLGQQRQWEVSLYHAPGKEHHDLSQIAVKHGGGGHRGACGFKLKNLPF